jgi:hypothetical protein
MAMCMDSPSGERPPKLERSIGPWIVVVMWWPGRETAQDVIPEASARAQVQAAHARDEAMA